MPNMRQSVIGQRGEDAGLHVLAGRRGEGEHRGRAELFSHFAQAAVLGAKVMTPLIDAVRFVNHKEGRIASLELLALRFAAHEEALRRDVEQLESLTGQQRKAYSPFLHAEIAVDEGCGNLLSQKIRDLLGHQCLEGTHYHRHAAAQHGRELEA
jgi:hypothetical protein